MRRLLKNQIRQKMIFFLFYIQNANWTVTKYINVFCYFITCHFLEASNENRLHTQVIHRKGLGESRTGTTVFTRISEFFASQMRRLLKNQIRQKMIFFLFYIQNANWTVTKYINVFCYFITCHFLEASNENRLHTQVIHRKGLGESRTGTTVFTRISEFFASQMRRLLKNQIRQKWFSFFFTFRTQIEQ